VPIPEEGEEDVQGFLEAAHAVVEGVAEGGVLRIVPAGAEAKDQAPRAYLINRVGLLAPDPGGMAVWNFADYVAAEGFIRRTPPSGPVRIVQAGLYRNFGEEIV